MIANQTTKHDLWHLELLSPNDGPHIGPGTLRDSAACAEQVGADSLWVTDHVAVPTALAPTYGTITEALVTAGFLAACTTRADVGVSALVVPQRPLLITLKQVMSAQVLAVGRLILAVAVGWTDQEFRNLGARLTSWRQRLDSWDALLAETASSSPGRLDLSLPDLDITDAHIAPGFVGGTLPPLWVAGHAEAALRRAAQAGTWHPVGRPRNVIAALAQELHAMNPLARTVLRVTVTGARQADREALDAGGRCRITGPDGFVAEQLMGFMSAGCDGFVVDLLAGEGRLPDRIEWFWGDIAPQLRGRESESPMERVDL